MMTGESLIVKAIVTPPDATDPPLKWDIKNSNIATITDNGILKAVSEGITTISVRILSDDAIQPSSEAQRKLIVNNGKIESIKLYDEIVIGKGTSSTLIPVISPPNASETELRWISENESILTVDQGGTITGISYGETGLQILAGDRAFRFNAKVKPIINPTNIQIELDYMNMVPLYEEPDYNLVGLRMWVEPGFSYTIPVQVTPDNATNTGLRWFSSNEAVAYIDQSGTVTAAGLGNAIIKVSLEEDPNIKATLEFNVREWCGMWDFLGAKIQGISNSEAYTEYSLFTGSQFTVYPYVRPLEHSSTFFWECAESDILKFDDKGDGLVDIQGLSEGDASLICYADKETDGYVNMTITMHVNNVPMNCKITGIVEMNFNEEASLYLSASEEIRNTTLIRCSSSNPDIISVPAICMLKDLKATSYNRTGVATISINAGKSTFEHQITVSSFK